MAIPLGRGEKREIVHGKSFAFTPAERVAFESELRAEQKRRVVPLIRRIVPKAERQLLVLKEKLLGEAKKKGKMGASVAGDILVRGIDTFIIEQLPLHPDAKREAIRAQGHEATLSEFLARAMMKERVSRVDATAAIERGLATYHRLPAEYKRLIPEQQITALAKKLIEIQKSNSKVLFTAGEALALKAINTARVRSILGEEMATVYAQVYSRIKTKIAAIML